MGALDERRRRQGLAWLEAEIRQGLLGAFRAHPQVAALLTGLEGDILAGRASPPIAAKKLVQAFLDSGSTNA
jgi:LAO/AO transport system kinase